MQLAVFSVGEGGSPMGAVAWCVACLISESSSTDLRCRLYDVISAAPKISFGARDKRRAGGKAIAGYRYIGPLHASAEGLGADTPGPGHYEMKVKVDPCLILEGKDNVSSVASGVPLEENNIG